MKHFSFGKLVPAAAMKKPDRAEGEKKSAIIRQLSLSLEQDGFVAFLGQLWGSQAKRGTWLGSDSARLDGNPAAAVYNQPSREGQREEEGKRKAATEISMETFNLLPWMPLGNWH